MRLYHFHGDNRLAPILPARNNCGRLAIGYGNLGSLGQASDSISITPDQVVRIQMKREYPDRPIVGVGGVVVNRNRVLLIRRGSEPLKGEWSIPGGLVELGEELSDGARREVKEETGLDVEPLEVLMVFDRIIRDGERVRYHYVIVDYVCRRRGGRLKPDSDVIDARWVRREDLPQYHLTEKATAVVLAAFAFFNKPRQ